MTPRRLAVALTALLTAGLLTACSSSGPGGLGPNGGGGFTPPGAGGTSAPPGPGSAPQTSSPASAGAVSKLTMRYANLFTRTTAGPALDIYDTPMGRAAAPLIRNLAYGAMSAYVHPSFQPYSTVVSYYAMPAGEDPVKQSADAKGLGGYQDDGSHPQLTVVLTGEKDTIEAGPLGGLSFSERVEKGTDTGSKGPVAPPPPAGMGEFLAEDSQVADVVPGLESYLMIDSSCAAPLNGDPQEPDIPLIFAADGKPPVSSFAVFAQPPGLHHLAVATTDVSENLTCAQLTRRQSATTSTLAAGQQVETFVYGTSATDLHLLVAPIGA